MSLQADDHNSQWLCKWLHSIEAPESHTLSEWRDIETALEEPITTLVYSRRKRTIPMPAKRRKLTYSLKPAIMRVIIRLTSAMVLDEVRESFFRSVQLVHVSDNRGGLWQVHTFS